MSNDPQTTKDDAGWHTLREENERLREALEFYATPDTYHAIAFMCDRPCGAFSEDFDDNQEWSDYDRPMPGKKAREALGNEIKTTLEQLRQRNSDLSYMAGERDILLKAIEEISDYDDGTKLAINGECGSLARHALEKLQELREEKPKHGDEIEERFERIVVEHLGCELRKVTKGASFIDTLGADSLDAIELLSATEDEFEIEISDDEAEKIETVEDAVKLIRRKSK